MERDDEKMKGGGRPITIRGIVIPVDWDEKGKVIAAAVSTYTEDEYLINNDYRGRELLHLIQEEVEVKGIVTQNKDKKMIGVQKYVLRKTQE